MFANLGYQMKKPKTVLNPEVSYGPPQLDKLFAASSNGDRVDDMNAQSGERKTVTTMMLDAAMAADANSGAASPATEAHEAAHAADAAATTEATPQKGVTDLMLERLNGTQAATPVPVKVEQGLYGLDLTARKRQP